MSKRQKEWLKEMGFGRLLCFNVNGIPSKIGHFVVENLDTNSMFISTPKGTINIDINRIHNLLGLPTGGIPISSLKKPDEYADSYLVWRRRYGRRSIAPVDIVDNITVDAYDDHLIFKLDFLVLFITTMVGCWRNGLCKYGVVERLDLQVDIKEYDWCGYVVEAIRDSKIGWKRCSKTPPFVGPLTILTLLYVDGVSCRAMNEARVRCPLSYWTLDNLQKRERIEINGGGFGLGDILEQRVGGGDYESDGEDAAETINFDNSSIKGHMSLLSSIYNRIKQEKSNFENSIRECLIKFPGNTDVSDYVRKFEEIFHEGSNFDDVFGKGDTQKNDARCVRNEDDAVDLSGSKEEVVKPDGVEDVRNNLPETEIAGIWTHEVMEITTILERTSSSKKNSFENRAEMLSKDDFPNFSLGLTQETPITEKHVVGNNAQSKDIFETPINGVAIDVAGEWTQEMIEVACVIEKISESKKISKSEDDVSDTSRRQKSIANKKRGRCKQVASVKCSPYIDRVVNINKGLSKDERKIWNYLMMGAVDHEKEEMKRKVVGLADGIGEESNEIERTFNLDIFASYHGTVVDQFRMVSLTPGLEIYNEVIDCWAAVLNYEEKNRSPSSVRRLFCGTYPFYGWVITNPLESDEVRFAFFEKHLHHVLENKAELYTLKDFDVVLFPIFENRHFT
ncbi:hypothetical protein E3N88_06314 [Mikania micrantha]|uniref:Ubiquitin-like protease family profile domain-containing protein n=1 Tax=Mikania micrantha TaxID=192012 RepID=A0A5N6PNH0_9ASTR|nr:hypothetical protein E3N88_06314 [Mikania micrantha]